MASTLRRTATRKRTTARRPKAGRRGRAGKKARRARPVAAPIRWNPDPDDVQKSVVKLVLSLIEFIRRLMERQAIRRLEAKTLSAEEIENVGLALMKLEETVRQIAKRFKLNVEDLNLDLGPIGRLH
jgi:Gas vesicle protein K